MNPISYKFWHLRGMTLVSWSNVFFLSKNDKCLFSLVEFWYDISVMVLMKVCIALLARSLLRFISGMHLAYMRIPLENMQNDYWSRNALG